jgi:hypothetical protein
MTGINGKNLGVSNLQSHILFFDSSIDLDEIKPIIVKYSPLIITFDYRSHSLLQQNNIDHKISDKYLQENDLIDLQNQVYKFSTWYKSDVVLSDVQFEGINIGRLFHEQIVDYLVKFLKKSQEIFQIYNENKNSAFLAGGIMYGLIENLTNSIIEIKQSKKEEYAFAHDKVKFSIKIGNRHFMFLISRSFYLKLKRFSEIAINFMFNSKIKNLQKTILLVEIPTDRFKNFFLKSKHFPLNPVFYGRRRPAIWNYKTYKIMRNSNCKIATMYSVLNPGWTKSSKMLANDLEIKIKSLWKNDDFFIKYFMQNGISLWKTLKPKFEELINNRIAEIAIEIEIAKGLFDKHNFSSVLVLHEVGMTEQIVTGQAKKRGIPIFLLQMGHHFDTREAKDYNISSSVYPIDADRFLVWGNIAARDALSNGNIPQSDIINLGSPRYDGIFADYPVSDGNYILLATPGPGNMHINGQVIKNIESYLLYIKRICEITTKNNLNLIIKPHPSVDDLDIRKIVYQINPKIKVVTTGDILPLISSCSLMILMGLSTSILECLMLKKPVICVPAIDFNFGIPEPIRSKFCLTASIDELEQIIPKILDDENYKRELIEKGNRYLAEYLSNLGNSSEKLLEFLKSA